MCHLYFTCMLNRFHLYIMCPPPYLTTSCVHLPTSPNHVSTSLPHHIMCPPPYLTTSCVHLPTSPHHVSISFPYISCVHLHIICPPPSPYTSCVHSTVMCTRQEGCVSLTKSRLDLGEVENTSGYSSPG